MGSTEVFNRCNISEDLIKRFNKLQTSNEDSSSKINEGHKKNVNLTGSPTGKKAALEKLLLSVPLDADIATFSEKKSVANPFIPLYSDNYEPSFCLPSSGYRSDSDGRTRRIRTSNSEGTSPNRSPKSERKVRRVKSLNTSSATDKLFEIRERLIKTKKEKEEVKETKTSKPAPLSNINTYEKKLNTVKTLSSSVARSKSFNTARTIRTTRNKSNLDEEEKSNENLILKTKNSLNSTEKIRQHFGNNSKATSENTTKSLGLKSNSFSTLQNAWEYRKLNSRDKLQSSAGDKNNKDVNIPSEVDGEKVHRRHRHRSSKSCSYKSDKSDSETESEDGNLTEAALKRLDVRTSKQRFTHTSNVKRRINSLNSESSDDNNNEFTKFETCSDKTLDSGIFDLAISNLSEDISKLSKRYDSNEFLLDDCLSQKSGYSSASESFTSLAESSTTYYDSENEANNYDMENRKKRSIKPKPASKTTMKKAVMNSVSKSLYDNPKSSQSIKLIGHENCHKSIGTSIMKGQVTLINNDHIRLKDNIDIKRKKSCLCSSESRISVNSQQLSGHDDEVKAGTGSKLKSCDIKNNEITKDSIKKKINDKTLSSSLRPKRTTGLSKTKSVETEGKHKPSSLLSTEVITENLNKKNQLKNNHKSFDKDLVVTKERSGAENMSSTTTTEDNSIEASHQQRKLVSTTTFIKTDNVKVKYAKACLTTSLKEKHHHNNIDDDSIINENETRIQNEINDNNNKKQKANSIGDDKFIRYDGYSENSTLCCNQSDQNNKNIGMDTLAKTKFLVDRRGSLIDQSTNKNKLVRQGDSIELQISLEGANKAGKAAGTVSKLAYSPTTPISSPTAPAKSPTTPKVNNNSQILPKVNNKQQKALSPASNKTQANPPVNPDVTQVSDKRFTSNSKGIQCSLLTEEIKALTSKGTIITVPNIGKQAIIKESITNELGRDILENIEFQLPEYLNMASTDDDSTSLDFTDSEHLDANLSVNLNENDNPLKLKIENVRLQKLLIEVEKARAGSVKALLHVNNLLNQVQSDNIHLEGEMKVCSLEKEKLNESIKSLQENGESFVSDDNKVGLPGDNEINRNRSDTVDKSLSIIVSSWKNEKKTLTAQLNKSKAKEEESEKDASRLRIQYKKIKEQLEHSNNAFTLTLKNNLQATKRMEEELQNSIEEKQELLVKLNEGKKIVRELNTLKQEMDELETAHVELQDEKDQLEEKCVHLEKQKKSLLYEQEELHEQIGHSQEIIDKLTDAEDELKDKLNREVKDKEYLQECLDETGQILYQLKNNEQRLLEDKDTLLDDLEAELQEKETLQSELTETMSEHKEIVDRLQQMNNIHITVRESLQQANKKEKNYQEEIEILTKTNHILHYTLELEKEERVDLQEMFEVIDMDHKKFKTEMVGKMRDMEKRSEELHEENVCIKEMKESFEEENKVLKKTTENQTETINHLTKQLECIKTNKESIEKELETLRNSGDSLERNISELRKESHDLQVELKSEKKKVDNLTINIEDTEETLENVTRDLTETKNKLEEHKNDNEDLRNKMREKQKRLRDLETTLADTSEQRDKYHNRMMFYEKETKALRKQVNEQTEEIGTLQLESQRFGRERDNYKRNCDMAVRDFETHKIKCTETLKKLKDEILDLSKKIVEKDRISMKQKEQFQDQIDNTQNDLHLFRSMLDTDLKKRSRDSCVPDKAPNSEKLDINVLKTSHGKFRDEYKNQMTKLEGMLRDSKEQPDTVTVVQSPMSKIKLEELKQIRNEMFELNTDLTNLRNKFSIAATDIKLLQGKRSRNTTATEQIDEQTLKKTKSLDLELASLNNLMVKIERRHQAVMSQNSILLQRTLTDDDRTAKDLVKKFQVVSLEGENKQLKTLLGILKRKYDFNEQEIAEELKQVSDMSNGLLTPLNGDRSFTSDDDDTTAKLSSYLPAQNSTPQNDSNLRYDSSHVTRSNSKRSKNYSFFNEMMSSDSAAPVSLKYNPELNTRSSGVSSYSSEDDDFSPPARLPKRNNSTQSRNRRPRT